MATGELIRCRTLRFTGRTALYFEEEVRIYVQVDGDPCWKGREYEI